MMKIEEATEKKLEKRVKTRDGQRLTTLMQKEKNENEYPLPFEENDL